jgi:CheY-like chemotaxis protein
MTVAPATLLIVDDDEMNRHMLLRRLQRQGYQVAVAQDGVEALQLIRQQAFDLVLLDVMMPGISGIDVLKIVRTHRSMTELPVIMTTALDSSQDIVAALEAGANDYVTKPLDFPVALARIQAQLQMKRLAAARDDAPRDSAPGAWAEIGPGAVIGGKYRLEESIGAGAAGSVYKATHLVLGRHVAVKVLRSTEGVTPEQRTRFQREGIAAVRIKHPNAVAVTDFGLTAEGIMYLVMELLEGYSLADELASKGTLSLARAAEILLPICDVLAEAHALGIIHRDLKPANIFLHQTRTAEVVKVVDFGIAKMLDDEAADAEQHLTLVGHVLGTPAYMAPERLQNRPYDGRADVYSLGILLFRMLAGRLPFEAPDGDPLKVALMQLNDPPPSLRDLAPTVPPAVEALVRRALAKDATRRPTVVELGQEFVAAMRPPGARIAGHIRRGARAVTTPLAEESD